LGENHPPILTDEDRLLLYYLAIGSTQENTAKRMQMSERTLRRRVDELCRRFGATSLFALGIMLGQSGTVTWEAVGHITEC
jgi:DNA-binding NarL/FixJ family response regulator